MVDNRVKFALSNCGSKLSWPKLFWHLQPGFHRFCFCENVVISNGLRYYYVYVIPGFKNIVEVLRDPQRFLEVFRDS